MDEKRRCDWVNDDPCYLEYHDIEWGKPLYGRIRLFELLCLEGQQAGLSWLQVLKKRERYRQVFHRFDPHKVARMEEQDIEKLMRERGLIRHRLKLNAIVLNAQAYLQMQQQGEDFAQFLWSFVSGAPQLNYPATSAEIPTHTEVSEALSKALRKRGFKFVGPIICYAFMQASGMVNDHIKSCFLGGVS